MNRVIAQRGVISALGSTIILLLLMGCAGQVSTAEPSFRPTSLEQSELAYRECMTDKGWELEVNADGSTGTEVPAGQLDRFNADSDACAEATSIVSTMTDKDWVRLHGEQIAVADCLEEIGYPTTRPSLQSYLDQPRDSRWTPYVELLKSGTIAMDQLMELEKTCPQATGF